MRRTLWLTGASHFMRRLFSSHGFSPTDCRHQLSVGKPDKQPTATHVEPGSATVNSDLNDARHFKGRSDRTSKPSLQKPKGINRLTSISGI